MRQFLLAILLLFAVQPSPAALADNCGNMAKSHHGQAAALNKSQQKPDCCEHGDGHMPNKSCDPASHCGACVAAAVFVPATVSAVSWGGQFHHLLTANSAPPTKSHAPPFRPPIS